MADASKARLKARLADAQRETEERRKATGTWDLGSQTAVVEDRQSEGEASSPEHVVERAAQLLNDPARDKWDRSVGVSRHAYARPQEAPADAAIVENLHSTEAPGTKSLVKEWKRSAIFDIESGLWASPFFGSFAAIRFHLLCLLGQVLLIICSTYTEDGLMFPGWIVFMLAAAAIGTGFPAW